MIGSWRKLRRPSTNISSNTEFAQGMCFQHAVKEAKRGGTVVHALVTNPVTSKRFFHAWVERKGKVYDDLKHHLGISRFYELFQPEEVRRYSDIEAMVYAVRTGHYGPWESDETGPPPPVLRKRRGK
jgi:hypothetical protein